MIPLYLEGGALAVYLELSTGDQEGLTKLNKALVKLLSDSSLTTFSKIKGLRWKVETERWQEKVDLRERL